MAKTPPVVEYVLARVAFLGLGSTLRGLAGSPLPMETSLRRGLSRSRPIGAPVGSEKKQRRRSSLTSAPTVGCCSNPAGRCQNPK